MKVGTQRNIALDGLRGVAALVVVFHHLFLTNSWFADRVGRDPKLLPTSFLTSPKNLLEYTPLHIFFAGTEAVFIFFVLSGYVLLRSAERPNVTKYLTSRMIRLYVPIFGAVSIAFLLARTVSRDPSKFESWWLRAHASIPSVRELAVNAFVLHGTTLLDSSLWSMKYEIIFSISLIVFVIFWRFTGKVSFHKTLAMYSLSTISIVLGQVSNNDLLSYLPVFYFGVLLHQVKERLKFASLRFLIGLMITISPWCLAGFGVATSNAFSFVIIATGATIIVDSARSRESALARLLSKKIFGTLGKYSYSLYLIHAPVLVTTWYLLGQPSSRLGFFLQVFLSFVMIFAATIFLYNLAEKPSLKWIAHRRALS